MARVFHFNKKRLFLLAIVFNCIGPILWLFKNRSDGFVQFKQFDLHPIPYAKIDPCDSLDNCPDIRLQGNTTLRRSQLVLTRLLRVLDLICKKHDINYFIYKGSILGAARHKGVNPFDDDVDVALTQRDFDKLSSVIQRELPSDVFYQTEETDPFYKKPRLSYMFAKLRDKSSCYTSYLSVCLDKCMQNGLQVDISVLQEDGKKDLIDLFSDSSLIVRFLRGPLRLKRNDIFPLQKVMFEGFLIPVPNQWKKLLVFWYGEDYMSVPSPFDRKLFSGSNVDPLHSCVEKKQKMTNPVSSQLQ